MTFLAIGIKVVDGKVRPLDASRPLGVLADAQAEISSSEHYSGSGRPAGTSASVSVAFANGTLHQKTLNGDIAISAAQWEVAQFNMVAAAGNVQTIGYPRSLSRVWGLPEPQLWGHFKCCGNCISIGCHRRFGTPVDLTLSATECDCQRHHHYHLATLVVDPDLSAEEQARLVRYLLSSGEADWIIHSTAYANMKPKRISSWKRMFGSGRDQPNSLDVSRCVRPDHLAVIPLELLRRTQNAIRAILESGVFARHSSDHNVDEPALRRHEWDIAVALKDISRLDRELDRSTMSSSPGPMTVAVLESQRQALMPAKNSTLARIGALEQYGFELKTADAAERDLQAALKASSNNDKFIDLVVRTAGDELAVSELNSLAEQAAAANEVFRQHLHQASLAAKALILRSYQSIDKTE